MNKKSKAMSELSRKRWGNRLVCSIKQEDGMHVVYCKYNGREYVGEGLTNILALTKVFYEINKLGESKKQVARR